MKLELSVDWPIERTLAAAQALQAIITDAENEAKKQQQLAEKGKKPSDDDDDDDGEGEGDSKSGEPSWKPFRRKSLLPGLYGDTWDDFEPWMPPSKPTPRWEKPHPEGVEPLDFPTNQWMHMEVERPVLRKPKWAKGAGCTDTGAIFRAPYRLTCDQKVFRQNRAKRSGSLLVDVSGSMCLAPSQVKAIVKAVPAAVIGIYSGNAGSSNTGVVKILAQYGKLVTEDKEYIPYGGFNGVDGPALRWLAVQPRPRIWISDGIVTGLNDSCGHNLFNEVDNICERYRIIRKRSLREAQKLL